LKIDFFFFSFIYMWLFHSEYVDHGQDPQRKKKHSRLLRLARLPRPKFSPTTCRRFHQMPKIQTFIAEIFCRWSATRPHLFWVIKIIDDLFFSQNVCETNNKHDKKNKWVESCCVSKLNYRSRIKITWVGLLRKQVNASNFTKNCHKKSCRVSKMLQSIGHKMSLYMTMVHGLCYYLLNFKKPYLFHF